MGNTSKGGGRKTKTSTPDPTPDALGMGAQERLEYILDAVLRNPKRGIPTFIGPTQMGKTYFLTRWAVARGFTVIMVNPQNDLPEDIGGWPYRDGKILHFTQPSLIPAEFLTGAAGPWALFVDELDKAKEDTLSSMLTLFSVDERRLRHTRVPEGVPLLVAMNEPSGVPLPDPLLARMLFLAYPPPDLEYWTRYRRIGHIVRKLFKMPSIAFPARPETLGAYHKIEEWMDDPMFWTDKGLRETVVRGLTTEANAVAILAELLDQVPNPSVEWAKVATIQDIVEYLWDVLNAATFGQTADVIKTLAERANTDATQELEKILHAFFDTHEAVYGFKRPEQEQAAKAALRKKFDTLNRSERKEPAT